MANLIEKAKIQIDSPVRAAYKKAAQAGTLPSGATLRGNVERYQRTHLMGTMPAVTQWHQQKR